MSSLTVEKVESASPLVRGLIFWFPVAGPVLLWTLHLVYLASAEHWAHTHHQWEWTLNAVTLVTALGTVLAIFMAWRLLSISKDGDEAGQDDTGQLKFMAQLGLLVGIINLALIMAEGAYVWFLPHS